MLLIFGVRRPDVVSWGDLAILRGCGCCTESGPSTRGPSSACGSGTAPTAPLPACTSGPSPAAPAGADGPGAGRKPDKNGAAHMTDRQRWQAVLDGATAGMMAHFSRRSLHRHLLPSLLPSRPPRRDRVRFFPTADAALAAGFRPAALPPGPDRFFPGPDVAAEAMALLHRHFGSGGLVSRAERPGTRSPPEAGRSVPGSLRHHPPRLPGNASGNRGLPPVAGTDQPVAQIAGGGRI